MRDDWMPDLQMDERGGRCRLSLGSWAYGEGESLQDAADDLVVRLGQVALSARRTGWRVTSETPLPDRRMLDFLWELGELAARGRHEEIRARFLLA